jgi:hypothetical protein
VKIAANGRPYPVGDDGFRKFPSTTRPSGVDPEAWNAIKPILQREGITYDEFIRQGAPALPTDLVAATESPRQFRQDDVCTDGKIDVLEIFAGSARVTAACADKGLVVGQPIDISAGFDLLTPQGQAKAWHILHTQRPAFIFMAPVCTSWCSLANLQPSSVREEKRRKALPMIAFCATVAWHQLATGGHFIIENPTTSAVWNLPDITDLANYGTISRAVVHMCAYGLEDPFSHLPMRKSMTFLTNIADTYTQELVRQCPGNHSHQAIVGSSKGYGSRALLSQAYPWKLCDRLASILHEMHMERIWYRLDS